jgi:transcriptional regulator with XRE-family HTH domain
MDNRDEVRDFLTSRRARLTPDKAGVPFYGGQRRVKGLRREEVAMLAGMSTDYYTRLERGKLDGASETVLDSLARALQLDEAERGHLFDLAAASNAGASPPRRTRGTATPRVRQGVQRLLDTITTPAYVRNNRTDVLATNTMARALYGDALTEAGRFNLARFLFLDSRSQEFFGEWSIVARDCVAALRVEAGRNPYDRNLTDLVGELSTRSDEFRTWWATHNVKVHTTATKTFHHPGVGAVELTGEALLLPGDEGLTIITYTVEPNSPSAQALDFLASWTIEPTVTATATPDDTRPTP